MKKTIRIWIYGMMLMLVLAVVAAVSVNDYVWLGTEIKQEAEKQESQNEKVGLLEQLHDIIGPQQYKINQEDAVKNLDKDVTYQLGVLKAENPPLTTKTKIIGGIGVAGILLAFILIFLFMKKRLMRSPIHNAKEADKSHDARLKILQKLADLLRLKKDEIQKFEQGLAGRDLANQKERAEKIRDATKEIFRIDMELEKEIQIVTKDYPELVQWLDNVLKAIILDEKQLNNPKELADNFEEIKKKLAELFKEDKISEELVAWLKKALSIQQNELVLWLAIVKKQLSQASKTDANKKMLEDEIIKIMDNISRTNPPIIGQEYYLELVGYMTGLKAEYEDEEKKCGTIIEIGTELLQRFKQLDLMSRKIESAVEEIKTVEKEVEQPLKLIKQVESKDSFSASEAQEIFGKIHKLIKNMPLNLKEGTESEAKQIYDKINSELAKKPKIIVFKPWGNEFAFHITSYAGGELTLQLLSKSRDVVIMELRVTAEDAVNELLAGMRKAKRQAERHVKENATESNLQKRAVLLENSKKLFVDGWGILTAKEFEILAALKMEDKLMNEFKWKLDRHEYEKVFKKDGLVGLGIYAGEYLGRLHEVIKKNIINESVAKRLIEYYNFVIKDLETYVLQKDYSSAEFEKVILGDRLKRMLDYAELAKLMHITLDVSKKVGQVHAMQRPLVGNAPRKEKKIGKISALKQKIFKKKPKK